MKRNISLLLTHRVLGTKGLNNFLLLVRCWPRPFETAKFFFKHVEGGKKCFSRVLKVRCLQWDLNTGLNVFAGHLEGLVSLLEKDLNKGQDMKGPYHIFQSKRRFCHFFFYISCD